MSNISNAMETLLRKDQPAYNNAMKTMVEIIGKHRSQHDWVNRTYREIFSTDDQRAQDMFRLLVAMSDNTNFIEDMPVPQTPHIQLISTDKEEATLCIFKPQECSVGSATLDAFIEACEKYGYEYANTETTNADVSPYRFDLSCYLTDMEMYGSEECISYTYYFDMAPGPITRVNGSLWKRPSVNRAIEKIGLKILSNGEK